MLSIPQWSLLKAIAKEGIVYQPTSGQFIASHQLNSSATVLRSLKTLMKYELVYSDYNEEGVLFYGVYDIFLQRWAEGK